MEDQYLYLKISEMADMFNISTKTLRLYEKRHLFMPAFIDKITGYRYYSLDQANRLNTILSLKSVGFSLKEVKDMFERNLSSEELSMILQQKRAVVQKQVDSLMFTAEALDGMIEAAEFEGKNRLTGQEEAEVLGKVACLDNVRFYNELINVFWL